MKIIGKTETGFIIEATKDELYNIQGEYSHYSDKKGLAIKVGDSFDVGAAFHFIHTVRNDTNRLKGSVKDFRGLLDKVDAYCNELGKETHEEVF